MRLRTRLAALTIGAATAVTPLAASQQLGE